MIATALAGEGDIFLCIQGAWHEVNTLERGDWHDRNRQGIATVRWRIVHPGGLRIQPFLICPIDVAAGSTKLRRTDRLRDSRHLGKGWWSPSAPVLIPEARVLELPVTQPGLAAHSILYSAVTPYGFSASPNGKQTRHYL